jgi:hypothetical protein
MRIDSEKGDTALERPKKWFGGAALFHCMRLCRYLYQMPERFLEQILEKTSRSSADTTIPASNEMLKKRRQRPKNIHPKNTICEILSKVNSLI